jgi:hypothetical protein
VWFDDVEELQIPMDAMPRVNAQSNVRAIVVPRKRRKSEEELNGKTQESKGWNHHPLLGSKRDSQIVEFTLHE